MNRDIMREAGFGEQLALIDEGKCPWCKKPIDMNDFRNEISKREYGISGLCQKCQDGFFKKKRNKQSSVPKCKCR